MVDRAFTLGRVIVAAFVLLAVLFAAGWLTRDDPARKPYLQIVGGGFIFNYRVADVFYGFTAVVQRPLPTGSIVEATLPPWRCAQPRRSSGGITMSLLIMVASATLATASGPQRRRSLVFVAQPRGPLLSHGGVRAAGARSWSRSG